MANWWADRLSKAPVGTRPPTSVSQAPSPYQNPYSPPNPIDSPRLPSTKPPPSSKQDEHCPSCDSVNYMSAPGSKYMRCFDCGYPQVQAGTGVGSTSSDATSKKATQVESGGYNPKVIVGRVE